MYLTFWIVLYFLTVVITTAFKGNVSSTQQLRTFPKNFKIGFASSSYQIEGGSRSHGKGENIWDRFTHDNTSRIVDNSNGDVAADSYRLYKQDVALIKQMEGQVYRFSISWARILPSGFANKINPAGVEYYKNLINELLANNIEPMVTLYHWELPQPLQELGGWTNERIVDYFADYARIVFENFGDQVKKWITINEPYEMCYFGHSLGIFAPGIQGNGIAEYLAGHNVLKAHARVYHLYHNEFRSKQQGIIGITLSTMAFEPKTNNLTDIVATKRFADFQVGWFAHPIFSAKGDYPESMKIAIAENSKSEGFPRSRLPEFDDAWISYIRGTSDFYGINHYTTLRISHQSEKTSPSWQNDVSATITHPDEWPKSASYWLRVAPHGFRSALNYVKNEYNNPLVYVTENGVSDKGSLEDDSRIFYYNSYMKEMLQAIYTDGVNVQMYIAWALLDDFEWTAGYTEKFGIISVDFNDPERKRTPKKSASYFQRVLRSRQLDP